MIDPLWSWVLTIAGCTGLWFAGMRRWRRLGWAICLGQEVLWLIYALITEQHGFLLGVVVFSAVYGRNLIKDWASK